MQLFTGKCLKRKEMALLLRTLPIQYKHNYVTTKLRHLITRNWYLTALRDASETQLTLAKGLALQKLIQFLVLRVST
jgi:hypothetical protein